MSTEELKRLPRRNLTLYASSEEIMARLRDRLEANTDSEIVRNAVKFLDRLLADEDKGLVLEVRPRGAPRYVVRYRSLAARSGENLAIVKRNIILNDAAIARLSRMKRMAGVTSDSEIVRRALRYLDLISTEAANGAEFVVVDTNRVDPEPDVRVRMDIFVCHSTGDDLPVRVPAVA
ncbi:MAG: hypothetical protein C0486_04990 [Erythrobacter sp.]|nr:hypothetical protein [Erythrobacter sp.]MBA4079820.1 hypothetical protein [Erythrobacter sp.]